MSTEGCSYQAEDLPYHSEQIPIGLRNILKNNVREQTPGILKCLSDLGRQVSGKSLLCAITVAGLAPVVLPIIGIATPTGLVAEALFEWATDIGVGAVGGWLTGFAAHLKDNNVTRLTYQNEELLLAETKRLVDRIENGDIELAIGICKAIKKNQLLETFEEEYRRQISNDHNIVEEHVVNTAIDDAKTLIATNSVLAEIINKREEENALLKRQIFNLGSEFAKIREENQNLYSQIDNIKVSNDQINTDIQKIVSELNNKIIRPIGSKFLDIENKINSLASVQQGEMLQVNKELSDLKEQIELIGSQLSGLVTADQASIKFSELENKIKSLSADLQMRLAEVANGLERDFETKNLQFNELNERLNRAEFFLSQHISDVSDQPKDLLGKYDPYFYMSKLDQHQGVFPLESAPLTDPPPLRLDSDPLTDPPLPPGLNQLSN